MQAHTVRSAQARPKRKRVGRGDGSGKGTYSGRGMKGQKARSGGGVRPGFEGGQNPQIKGLPMLRGFKNPFRTEYQVVNVGRLASIPEDVTDITPPVLKANGMVRHADRPVKLLGGGEVERAFAVSGVKVTASARARIEAAGGSVEA
ncbi:MAG: 50S ribosomal protein L15 [Chloroflexota bacterium]|nr:50S ribosomal protein L15 [Chloroflexota bacterium]MDE2884532.1 50S ribosomal protein L15 [Chloroflexota bacterium]